MYKKSLILLCLVLTLCSGCWRKKQCVCKPHVSCQRARGKRDLRVTITRGTSAICVREIGIDLTNTGFVMVCLHIENRGGDRYVFRPSYCALERVSREVLADYIFYDVSSRCVWLSVPSVIFWWPAIPLIVLPCGLMWNEYNYRLDAHLTQRLIGPTTTCKIAPYEVVDKFFFVPESSWEDRSSIGFFDKDTGELVTFTTTFT